MNLTIKPASCVCVGPLTHSYSSQNKIHKFSQFGNKEYFHFDYHREFQYGFLINFPSVPSRIRVVLSPLSPNLKSCTWKWYPKCSPMETAFVVSSIPVSSFKVTPSSIAKVSHNLFSASFHRKFEKIWKKLGPIFGYSCGPVVSKCPIKWFSLKIYGRIRLERFRCESQKWFRCKCEIKRISLIEHRPQTAALNRQRPSEMNLRCRLDKFLIRLFVLGK